MTHSATDTSSISFTAHYTGYVWYLQRWSSPAFVTRQGRLYHFLMQPLEQLARGLIGQNVQTTLITRHALLDRELQRNIDAGHTQVLELACGLSPRGWSLRQRHPHLLYVEADLPAMAAHKQRLLTGLDVDVSQHRVVSCNILEESGPLSLESVLSTHFDRTRPITVISEGLVNYFRRDTIAAVWSRLGQALHAFPAACYLTDNYVELTQHPMAAVIRQANRWLALATRSSFTLHFRDAQEAEQQFLACGFEHLQYLDPQQELTASALPRARGESLVRVVRASIGEDIQPTR